MYVYVCPVWEMVKMLAASICVASICLSTRKNTCPSGSLRFVCAAGNAKFLAVRHIHAFLHRSRVRDPALGVIASGLLGILPSDSSGASAGWSSALCDVWMQSENKPRQEHSLVIVLTLAS